MQNNKKNSDAKAGLIIFFLIFFFVLPFLLIWSINTLGGFGLLYDFKNWLAVVIILLSARLMVSRFSV